MKRLTINDLPWDRIQVFYDAENSGKDVCKTFRISSKTLLRAKNLGLFKPATASRALEKRHKKAPRDYSKSRQNKAPLANYRMDCRFNFNLADFCSEFDFSQIEKFGWYKAKNKGDNQGGISRDHMVSVKFGFENKIDPKIIAHPANCALMRHGLNVSKSSKCSISLDELLKRIEKWNNKFLLSEDGID